MGDNQALKELASFVGFGTLAGATTSHDINRTDITKIRRNSWISQ